MLDIKKDDPVSATELTGAEARAAFWQAIDDHRAGMLGAGSARHVPMTHYPSEEESVLWFMTAEGTDLAKACEGGAEASFILAGGTTHARLEGRGETVVDRAKLEELWNPVAEEFYEGGIDDPSIRLIRFTPKEAEVWESPSGVSFMWQLAKAKLTGDDMHMGRHYTASF